jgi:hypothetical protein
LKQSHGELITWKQSFLPGKLGEKRVQRKINTEENLQVLGHLRKQSRDPEPNRSRLRTKEASCRLLGKNFFSDTSTEAPIPTSNTLISQVVTLHHSARGESLSSPDCTPTEIRKN